MKLDSAQLVSTVIVSEPTALALATVPLDSPQSLSELLNNNLETVLNVHSQMVPSGLFLAQPLKSTTALLIVTNFGLLGPLVIVITTPKTEATKSLRSLEMEAVLALTVPTEQNNKPVPLSPNKTVHCMVHFVIPTPIASIHSLAHKTCVS